MVFIYINIYPHTFIHAYVCMYICSFILKSVEFRVGRAKKEETVIHTHTHIRLRGTAQLKYRHQYYANMCKCILIE